MNSACLDKQQFWRRLKANPAFAVRNSGSLLNQVARFAGFRVSRRMRGWHVGLKQRPDFLPRSLLCAAAAASPVDGWFTRIKDRSNCACRLPPGAATDKQAAGDLESYFATQRWGFLLEGDLAQPACWSAQAERLEDWLVRCPEESDPAWEPYSTSERVANLVNWVSLIPISHRRSVLPEGLSAFLARSVKWLAQRLEFYGDSTNNHILNNARALLMGGAALGHEPALEMGWILMRRMLPHLIGPGGFLRERSSHYQLVVLQWLCDALAMTRTASSSRAASEGAFLLDYCNRMARASSILCFANGDLTCFIGDISPDATPAQTAARLRALFPEIYPSSVPPPRGGAVDDWIWQSSGEARVIANFPTGSYPPMFPTHGHGDVPSFVWSHGDEPILIDPGRYRYSDDEISSRQRSAMSHNSLIVNGFSPCLEPFGRIFNWYPSPYGRAELLSRYDGCGGIYLEHDGLSRSTPVTRHERRLTLNERGLVVRDILEGTGAVEVELFLQWSPELRRATQTEWELPRSRRRVSAQVSLMRELLPARDESHSCSWAYGSKAAQVCQRFAGRTILPATIETVLKLR